jgi:hypothetical protein
MSAGCQKGVHWVIRYQFRVRWRAFVTVVMNISVTCKASNFMGRWGTVSHYERSSSDQCWSRRLKSLTAGNLFPAGTLGHIRVSVHPGYFWDTRLLCDGYWGINPRGQKRMGHVSHRLPTWCTLQNYMKISLQDSCSVPRHWSCVNWNHMLQNN